MTVLKMEVPESALGVLSEALTELRVVDPTSELGGQTLEVLEPVPVFVLGIEDAIDGLENAKLVNWRYLLARGEDTMVADIDADDEIGGKLSFNSLSEGVSANKFRAALEVANQISADSEIVYELRALEVPSLNMGAVWLKADDESVFIPFLDRQRSEEGAKSVAGDFEELIRSKAIAQKRFFDGEKGG